MIDDDEEMGTAGVYEDDRVRRERKLSSTEAINTSFLSDSISSVIMSVMISI